MAEILRLSDPSDLYIPSADIHQRVSEIGDDFSEKYADTDEVVLITVLLGAVIFAADLARAIEHPNIIVDTVAIKSYVGTKSSGKLEILKNPDNDLEDKHVLIAEDILDSGFTLASLVRNVRKSNPASLEVVTAFEKPECRLRGTEIPAPVTVGIQIGDVFVVGYGLDYKGRYRHLPHLSVCEEKAPDLWVPRVPLEPKAA